MAYLGHSSLVEAEPRRRVPVFLIPIAPPLPKRRGFLMASVL